MIGAALITEEGDELSKASQHIDSPKVNGAGANQQPFLSFLIRSSASLPTSPLSRPLPNSSSGKLSTSLSSGLSRGHVERGSFWTAHHLHIFPCSLD